MNNSVPSQSQQDSLKDAHYLYPHPEFKPQPQPLPGEDPITQPKPDHGEGTYQGHGRLEGLVALITGGDSGIGMAIEIACAREGADIVFYLPK